MNRFQQCLSKCTPCLDQNVPDINTHTGIEHCIMYRSSFRTFPFFLNPRAHNAHNTWTTLWSFRSFSSKTQSSFILSTITEQWKFSYQIFYIYPKRNILFECIPINFEFTVHSQLKNRCPKSQKTVYCLSKRFITKIDTGKQNRCSTVPAGWNLDLNSCTCNKRRFPQTDRWEIYANRAI